MDFHSPKPTADPGNRPEICARSSSRPAPIERDEHEEFPARRSSRSWANSGFMGMMVPEEWGGAGLDTISYVLAMEEISRVDASVRRDHVREQLPGLLRHQRVRDRRSEGAVPARPRLREEARGVRAFRAGGRERCVEPADTARRGTATAYVLNGTKNWITNGSTADVVLVMAATDRSKGAKGISTFIVEKGTPGFAVAKKEKKLGIRSSDTVSLSFTDCRVPAANRIGAGGDGFKFAMKTLDGGTDRDRRAGARDRAGVPGCVGRVREGTEGVRPSDRGAAGDPVQDWRTWPRTSRPPGSSRCRPRP